MHLEQGFRVFLRWTIKLTSNEYICVIFIHTLTGNVQNVSLFKKNNLYLHS